MSARLGFNEMPYIPWKGKTLTQITSLFKKNVADMSFNIGNANLFRANPVRLHRREIATPVDNVSCQSRVSSSIDVFNQPNGSIINSSTTIQSGLVNTLDDTFPNNTCEKPGSCITYVAANGQTVGLLSASDNAKRRVRSSGIIKKQFDISKNNDTYCTTTKQYLNARNISFQQNQYNFIRQGNSQAKPGSSLSSANVYSPNGINHCKRYKIVTDVSFQYQWIDANFYTVDVPEGYYTVDDINALLQKTMAANFHYYIVTSSHNINETVFFNNSYLNNQNIIFLLNIAYNSVSNQVELQALKANNVIFSDAYLSISRSATWSTPSVTVVPGFYILDNVFQNAIGFTPGHYPADIITSTTENTQTTLSNQVFVSSSTPGIQPLYVPINYKPNNPQFGQQGAVSSSSRILRAKYNSITNSTNGYANAYGKSVANALAYGVPENGYTVKDKLGYPNKKTPLFGHGEAKSTCKYIYRG